MDDRTLMETAVQAREYSYSPYSNFRVGAALLCADGSVYTGCDMENAAFTPGICAERTAIYKAVSEGKRNFLAIAIAGGPAAAGSGELFLTAPCGVCRQVLAEFNPELTMEVILVNQEGKTLELTLKDLLPYSFDSSYLE